MTQSIEALANGIADPGIDDFLGCRISVDSEYQAGQPIHIKVALVNSGHLPVWVLAVNTFLDPTRPGGLRISRDGSPLPYVGPTVLGQAPTEQSYLRILPNDSVSGEIDASGNYDLSVPGNYEAFISMPVIGAADEGAGKPPANEASLQLALVASETVSFRITGTALDRPLVDAHAEAGLADENLEDPLPKLPKDPKFRGMSPGEEKKISDAHFLAYKSIVEALASVQTTVDTPHYNSWFEARWPWGRNSGWEARRKKVTKTLLSMARHMARNNVTYAKEDPANRCGGVNGFLAYAYKSTASDIYFCPLGLSDEFLYGYSFYGTRTTLKWDYAFMVIHELSHAAASTDDHWYSWYMCSQLSVFNPELAVNNAQSYALFAMRESADDVPMLSNYMVKCFNEKNGRFVGWLQSDGHWVTLNGTDPNVAPERGCVTVRWYEQDGEKFLVPSDSRRYLGDNGNGGRGNGPAAWNLWSRACSVVLGTRDGEIHLHADASQRLGIANDLSKDVVWMGADAPAAFAQLRFEFQKV